MILVIDNYDSFVHNLARHMELAGWRYKVARNDKITLKEIETLKPEAIILSPGPCTPDQAGISIDIIKQFGPHTPILGVCLGHQCIGQAYGDDIVRANKPVHGMASSVKHSGDVLFKDIPNPFNAGRYHSLIIKQKPESELIATAHTAEGEIMAVKHKTHPVYGVQFHPESVLTDQGMQIIHNFTALALAFNNQRKEQAA